MWGDIIGIGGVIILIALAAYKLIKDKKQGKNQCSSCGNCNKDCVNNKSH